MKHFRTFFLYAAAGLLLGAYLYFFEKGPAKPEKEEKQKAKVFEKFVADDINDIRLEDLGTTVTAEKEPLEIVKDDKGAWSITSPRALRADESMVRNLLSTVGDLAADSTLEKPGKASDYGLDKPRLRASFKAKAGTSFGLELGDKNPAVTDRYVRVAGKEAYYLVPMVSLDVLWKKLGDMRDHSYLKTDLVLAKRVRVTRDGKIFEFEKDKDNVWSILRPIRERAEESRVRDLLNSWNGMRADGFENEKGGDLARYGLSPARAKVEVWPSDGAPATVILFGNKKGKTGGYFAKVEGDPVVSLAPEYFFNSTDIKINEFRDKSVLKFDPAKVKAIRVQRGARTFLYGKDDKGLWKSEGRLNAGEEGSNILNWLSAVSVADFAGKGAATGLAQPSLEVVFSMEDGTARTFRFGGRDKTQVYLASDRSKDVYLVSGTLLSQLESYFSAVLTPLPSSSPAPKP